MCAVNNNFEALQFASQTVRRDRAHILELAKSYPRNMVETDFEYDKAFVLSVIRARGYGLNYAAESLRNNREIVVTAVGLRGSEFQFASPDLRGQREILEMAIATHRYPSNPTDGYIDSHYHQCPLQFAESALQSDWVIVMAAIQGDTRATGTSPWPPLKETVALWNTLVAFCSKTGRLLWLPSGEIVEH